MCRSYTCRNTPSVMTLTSVANWCFSHTPLYRHVMLSSSQPQDFCVLLHWLFPYTDLHCTFALHGLAPHFFIYIVFFYNKLLQLEICMYSLCSMLHCLSQQCYTSHAGNSGQVGNRSTSIIITA